MVYFMKQQNLTATLKKLWKNEYVQTAVVIGLIALAVFGFWMGSQAVLNTPYPALAVVSGSMCIPYNGACDGWTHPFEHTLHIGDLIIVQGVAPRRPQRKLPRQRHNRLPRSNRPNRIDRPQNNSKTRNQWNTVLRN
jgi:signal peptidase I